MARDGAVSTSEAPPKDVLTDTHEGKARRRRRRRSASGEAGADAPTTGQAVPAAGEDRAVGAPLTWAERARGAVRPAVACAPREVEPSPSSSASPAAAPKPSAVAPTAKNPPRTSLSLLDSDDEQEWLANGGDMQCKPKGARAAAEKCSARLLGKCVRWGTQGYGFIQDEAGHDLFVRSDEVRPDWRGQRRLRPGELVWYRPGPGVSGGRANAVQVEAVDAESERTIRKNDQMGVPRHMLRYEVDGDVTVLREGEMEAAASAGDPFMSEGHCIHQPICNEMGTADDSQLQLMHIGRSDSEDCSGWLGPENIQSALSGCSNDLGAQRRKVAQLLQAAALTRAPMAGPVAWGLQGPFAPEMPCPAHGDWHVSFGE